jgi:hypothetical protein
MSKIQSRRSYSLSAPDSDRLVAYAARLGITPTRALSLLIGEHTEAVTAARVVTAKTAPPMVARLMEAVGVENNGRAYHQQQARLALARRDARSKPGVLAPLVAELPSKVKVEGAGVGRTKAAINRSDVRF